MYGIKVNTIRLGSSEFTMSIQEHIKLRPLAICMKEAVGIVDKDRLQKKKFKHGQNNPHKKVDQRQCMMRSQ